MRQILETRSLKRRANRLSVVTWLIAVVGMVNFGCGPSSKTKVLEGPASGFRSDTVTIVEWPPTVEMPDKERAMLRSKIDKALTAKGGFRQGPDLTISYRVVQLDFGNQFERHFWNGLGRAGEGSITVEVKYFGPGGEQRSDTGPIARTEVRGGITSGAFGGSFNEVYNRVAKDIRDYAIKNFKAGAKVP